METTSPWKAITERAAELVETQFRISGVSLGYALVVFPFTGADETDTVHLTAVTESNAEPRALARLLATLAERLEAEIISGDIISGQQPETAPVRDAGGDN